MAIGNGGDSAATRFRPRGTAPMAGLGRRNLLVEDPENPEGAQEESAATQEDTVSTPQMNNGPQQVAPRRAALPSRPMRSGLPTPDETAQSEAVTVGTLESSATATDRIESAAEVSSTSTAPSPSFTTPTSAPRGRGRPRTGTRTVVTPSSNPDGTTALSVSDARARMREIEQQVKQLRITREEDMREVDQRYRQDAQPLQAEYEGLSQLITSLTFGV